MQRKKSKQFFFEGKNQETFAHCCELVPAAPNVDRCRKSPRQPLRERKRRECEGAEEVSVYGIKPSGIESDLFVIASPREATQPKRKLSPATQRQGQQAIVPAMSKSLLVLSLKNELLAL
jgi:hypothetical protein